MSLDRDALICDLAETYHIYDMEAHPADFVATLAAGLRDDSRIKMKLAGTRIDMNTMLMASTLDAMNRLVWMQSEDGRKGKNKPESIFLALMSRKKESDTVAFDSAEDFEAERRRLLEEAKNGS